MKTIVTVQPLPQHMRLSCDSTKATTHVYDGHLSEQQVFEKVYPRAAELGHSHTSKNGYNEYSYSHS